MAGNAYHQTMLLAEGTMPILSLFLESGTQGKTAHTMVRWSLVLVCNSFKLTKILGWKSTIIWKHSTSSYTQKVQGATSVGICTLVCKVLLPFAKIWDHTVQTKEIPHALYISLKEKRLHHHFQIVLSLHLEMISSSIRNQTNALPHH